MPQDAHHFHFTAEMVAWRGPSPYHFVPVPAGTAIELRAIAPLVSYGWGVVPVTVRIGASEFTTSLFPKDGGYLIPIKDAVRHGEALATGDLVEIELTVGR